MLSANFVPLDLLRAFEEVNLNPRYEPMVLMRKGGFNYPLVFPKAAVEGS